MGLFTPTSEYKQVPGLDEYLRPFQSYDPGLGFAGKQAKSSLKKWGQDPSSGPLAQLAIARGGVGGRELLRNAEMGSNALMAGSQPALHQSITNSALLENADQTGQNVIAGAGQDYQNFANVFQQARQTRIGAELEALKAALSGKIGGNQIIQKGGFLGQLILAAGGRAAQAAGAAAGG